MYSLRKVFPVFLLSRVLLVFFVFVGANLELSEIASREGVNFHANLSLPKPKAMDNVTTVFGSADSYWYSDLAEKGYDEVGSSPQQPKNWVFFPLCPLLVKSLSSTGLSAFWSGVLLSNVAFLFALVVVYSFVQSEFRSEAISVSSVWLLCFYPTSHFFSAPLTESLFLLLTAGALLAVQREKILVSGIIIGLALVTRPTGALVFPAFALYLLQQRHKIGLPRLAVPLVIAPIGLLGFAYYLFIHTGDPLAFVSNQIAWGRGETNFRDLLQSFATLPVSLFDPWNFTFLHIVSVIASLCTSVYFLRERQYHFAVYIFLPMAFALSTGTLMSATRFLMVLFPFQICLAIIGDKNEFFGKAMLVIFAALFSFFCFGYGNLYTFAMA